MAELLDPDIASPFAPRRFDMAIETRRNIIKRRRCQQYRHFTMRAFYRNAEPTVGLFRSLNIEQNVFSQH